MEIIIIAINNTLFMYTFMWSKWWSGDESKNWFVFRLIHGGQFLNGLAGPTLMSAGPLLSTTWFAPDQRATATAVASLVGYLGAACSFLIGPLAVPAPNETQIVNSITHVDPGHIRDRIQYVLYTGAVHFSFNLQTHSTPVPRKAVLLLIRIQWCLKVCEPFTFVYISA